MNSYLTIKVNFISGSYHGKEWPPAPMRLYQAMIAGSASDNSVNGNLSESLTTAFHWLENQSAPSIFTHPAELSSVCNTFVPNNDDDITMMAFDSGKSSSVVETARKDRYAKKIVYRRLINHPVIYVWKINPDEIEQAKRIICFAESLHCLGRGIDMAWAAASIEKDIPEGLPCWNIQKSRNLGGELLRIPLKGSLDSIVIRQRKRYRRMKDRIFVNVPISYKEERYSCEQAKPVRHFKLYKLTALDNKNKYSWRQDKIITMAAMVRHAVTKQAPSELKGFVSGHVDKKDLNNRLSWIPLPSIGHGYADGGIRRVMILGPGGVDEKLMDRSLFKMKSSSLEKDGKPVANISEYHKDGAIWPYFKKAKEWHTITPMILPGYASQGKQQPGKLVPKKIGKLVRKALERECYPEVEEIWVQNAPFSNGSLHATDYQVAKYMRYSRMHVRVRFSAPVDGPVIAGIGRHYGLGLFAAND